MNYLLIKSLFLVTAVILTAATRCFALGNDICVFFDKNSPQITFATGDIKRAIEQKNGQVTLCNLADLTFNENINRVVITTISDYRTIAILRKDGIDDIPVMKAQSYALRTTSDNGKTYWVIGADEVGAMYGGLQLSENIAFSGLSKVYNEDNSPYIKNRGIKFNIPLDKDSPTYFYGNHGTSNMLAIKDVWDMNFWQTWFDEMARHRYNVLSLWSPAPFTSMINMEDEYPGTSINGVTGFDEQGNEVVVNNFTIDEKVAFWREVMNYGKDRGFDIYLFNWNIFLSTAEGKHGLSSLSDNLKTKKYLYKSTQRLLETYPNLTGIGITVGERMGDISLQSKEEWAWDSYGSAVMDYAQKHPNRKIGFIHRQHDGHIDDILTHFGKLSQLANVRFEVSFKYSEAHAHTTISPQRWQKTGMNDALDRNNITAWLTIRNDDWYFLHWANPQFVRDYVNNFPEVDKYVNGICIGSDGWVFTKEFVSKDPYYEDKNALSIQRTWYMQKIWGRIAYNPEISDDFFKQHLSYRYPEVSAEKLFHAWNNASGAIRLANEQVTGSWDLDMDWWPEGWTGDHWKGKGRFFTIQDTKQATPFAGSKLYSFKESILNKSNNDASAWITADKIEKMGRDALKIISSFKGYNDIELKLTLKDIQAQANLAIYNAYKFRATMYALQGDKESARNAIGVAFCYWERYTTIMSELYKPVQLQRNVSFKSWKQNDEVMLGDYHMFGGEGKPELSE